MKKASKLKIRRIELCLRQKEVADGAGISTQYLFQLENGRAHNPSIEVMKKLAAILKSTPQELFF